MKLRSTVLGLFVLAALLTACGSSPKSDSARMNTGGASGGGASVSKESAPGAASQAPPPQSANYSVTAADSAKPSPNGSAPLPSTALDRKIILNSQLQLKVKVTDDASTKIRAAVEGAGGYLSETTQQGTRESGRTVTMSLRVPAAQYNQIMNLALGVGEVINKREWTEDVTNQFLDLEARIKSKEAHLEQLQKLLSKGGNIKELMDVEQEISRVTGELDSMKGQLKFLSNRVEFSTITVTLYEPGAPTPLKDAKTVWERMKNEFIGSWNGTINFTGNLVVFLSGAIPVLVYLSIFGGAGYLIYRYLRRTLKRPPSA